MISRRHLLFLAISLIVGLAAGAALPPPPLPKLKQDNDPWVLPSSAELQRHIPNDMDAVTRSVRWNGDLGGTASERNTWRLAGIVNKNGLAALIITTDKPDAPLRVRVDGTLPDGSLMQSISRDSITTKLDACIKTFQLLQAEPVEVTGECEALEPPVQGSEK